MTKRWWIIALVFTLALSLTSCAKRRPQDLQSLPEYGFGYCDGSIGSFDVYVIRTKQDTSLFELSIIPVNLDQPGDIARINIANKSPSYREVVHEIVLQPNQEIFAGYLTENDLQTYDIVAITPFDGSGATFLEQTAEKEAICTLPLPGDGTPDGLGYGTPTTQARGAASFDRKMRSLVLPRLLAP
jgi:hypothetical protein